jgi:hypothetical protein
MSWKHYNEVIAALREGQDMSLSEARERYDDLREELGRAPTLDDVEIPEIYDDLDDWIEAYEDGEFDDYPDDEIEGGVDTGGAE